MKLRVRAIHFCYLKHQMHLETLKYFNEQIWKVKLTLKNTTRKWNYFEQFYFSNCLFKNISEFPNLFGDLNNRNG